jgi:hypothetical protein
VRLPALLIVPVLLLPACSATSGSEDVAAQPGPASQDEQRQESGAAAARLQELSAAAAVANGAGADLAVSTSTALFASAPVVVVAGAGDLPAQARGASAAVSLGAPLLLAGTAAGGSGPVAEELERLDAQAVLAVGDAAGAWAQDLDVDVVAAPGDDAELAALTRTGLGPRQVAGQDDVVAAAAALSPGGQVPVLAVEQAATPTGSPSGAAEPTQAAEPAGRDGDGELPRTAPPPPVEGTVVLATADAGSLAAVATARAAGAEVLVVPDPDPRADASVVERLAELAPEHVLGLGSTFGDDERFAARVATASTGVQLPGGGQLILPGKRYVALYGHPGSSALGVLGEQGPDASVARAARLAAEYDAVSDDAHTVPTFEVIATIASSAAGADGDYSSEATIEHLRPYVDAAARSGGYVVLDLQPGYTDFLTQARLYEELLVQPHVGLALDPEWRLAPGQRHMQQIGRVGADEVNEVADWLAELVRERQLPQKMLLLHQFKTFMLEERERIVADRDELAVVTQMDGHGPVSTKLDTWNVLLQNPPSGMTFGWKNFYDEDPQTMSPAQTLAVEPTPVFISYQ